MFLRNRFYFSPDGEGAGGGPQGGSGGGDKGGGAQVVTVTPADARTFLADYAHDPAALTTMPDPDVLKWHERVNGSVTKVRDSVKPQTVDWRATIKDSEAAEFAKTSTDPEHLAKRALEMRKQISTAIIKPGKDAKLDSPEAVAYRKSMGIPETAEGYKFEVPAGVTLSEGEKAIHSTMAKTFHKAGLTAEQAAILSADRDAFNATLQQAQVEADKKYAEESAAKLRADWGKDYDANKEFGVRAKIALANKAGIDVTELDHLETKDGKFVMDHPALAKIFALVGREMGEGSLGSVISESDKAGIDTQIADLRTKQASAPDGKTKNQYYHQEMALIAKRDGNSNIVGTRGRAA